MRDVPQLRVFGWPIAMVPATYAIIHFRYLHAVLLFKTSRRFGYRLQRENTCGKIKVEIHSIHKIFVILLHC